MPKNGCCLRVRRRFRGHDVRGNSCELRCAPVEEQPEPARDFDRAVLYTRALFDTWVLPGYNGAIILTGGEPMRYNLCRLFGVCSASFVR
jgi:hypothetical protein